MCVLLLYGMIGLARAACRALILTIQNPGCKGEFIKLQKCIIGFALCLATSLACFAKPREVFVTDEYDGLQYHFAEKIAKAVARDKKSNLFRIIVTQSGPSGWSTVSALYHRKQGILKTHSYSIWLMVDDESKRGADLAHREQNVTGWIYRNVTDAKLRKMAAMRTESYLLLFGGNDPHLTKLRIKGRQLYNRTTYWDIQPDGKVTRALDLQRMDAHISLSEKMNNSHSKQRPKYRLRALFCYISSTRY